MPLGNGQTLRASTLIAAVLASALAGASSAAGAPAAGGNAVVAPDPGCVQAVLEHNDDQSTDPVPLGFTIDFLGSEHDSVYVNNNGNVTFGDPLPLYQPFELGSDEAKIVAPFFADVDTTPEQSGEVTYGPCTYAGRPAFFVTWDGVGYFPLRVDKLNRFQLILVGRSDQGAGDFDIVFNYDRIEWESGEATGGKDGIGGVAARAGYSNGAGVALELPGSGESTALLDSNQTTGLVWGSVDSGGVAGRYRFAVRNGLRGDGPSPPGGLTATSGKGPLRVELSWSAGGGGAAGLAGYEVIRDGALLATVAGTSFSDTAVEWARRYEYAVRTLDGAGNRSAAVSAGATAAAADPPSTPGGLAGSGRTGPLRIELAWSASAADAGVVAYELLRDGSLVGAVAGTGYTDAAVTWGRAYEYAVRAVDGLGNRSAPAATVVAAPAAAPPSAPAPLTVLPRRAPLRIELGWGASASEAGVAGYEVLRDGAVIATVTAGTAYVDSAVGSARRYAYSVRAVDVLGARGSEATATATAPDVEPPSRPAALRAKLVTVKGKLRVQLGWKAASDAVGVSGYRVYRDGRLVRTTGARVFVAAPPKRKAQRYQVRAVDAARNLGPPASVMVRPPRR